mmetsp:Transcript_41303/g.123317  ORF Transcript_41303/g.123317 Transcript_41303/m.123317 type:complete len:228 (-) Transcript_41303:239-922(-)
MPHSLTKSTHSRLPTNVLAVRAANESAWHRLGLPLKSTSIPRSSITPAMIWYRRLLDTLMYTPYAALVPTTFCGWLGGDHVGSSCIFMLASTFVRPTPNMLAPKPTPSSLRPLRSTAPARCVTLKPSMPGCTFWNALSGQPANAFASAPVAAFPRVNESVGAGSHVSMKSAMSAMITLASTKSASFQKLSARFVFSAASLQNNPMPSSIAILTGNDVSAISRSRMPW